MLPKIDYTQNHKTNLLLHQIIYSLVVSLKLACEDLECPTCTKENGIVDDLKLW